MAVIRCLKDPDARVWFLCVGNGRSLVLVVIESPTEVAVMDPLYGVGGSCASTEQVRNVPRRDSSISLDDVAYKRFVWHALLCWEDANMVLSGVSLTLPSLPSLLLSANALKNHERLLLDMSVPYLHPVLGLRLRSLHPWKSIFSVMRAMSPG